MEVRLLIGMIERMSVRNELEERIEMGGGDRREKCNCLCASLATATAQILIRSLDHG